MSLFLLCIWLPPSLVASNLASPQIIKEEKDRQVINDVILGLHTLPADATPWDLLKAQVQADFAPFLIIIPKPVKRFIAAKAVILLDQFCRTVEGPATPMIRAGGKILGVVGSLLEYVGKDVQKLSKAMIIFGDNKNNNKNDVKDNRREDRSYTDVIPPTEREFEGNRDDVLDSTTDAGSIQSSNFQEVRLAHDQYDELDDDVIDYVIDIDENGNESEIQAYKNKNRGDSSSQGSYSTTSRHHDKVPPKVSAKEEEEEEDVVVFYPPEDAYEGEGELIEI